MEPLGERAPFERAVSAALGRADRPVLSRLGYLIAASRQSGSFERHATARIARVYGHSWDHELLWTAPTAVCGLSGAVPVDRVYELVFWESECADCYDQDRLTHAWDMAPPELLPADWRPA